MVFYLPLAGQNDFYFTLAEKNDMKARDLSFIPLNIPNHQVLVFVSYVQILSIEIFTHTLLTQERISTVITMYSYQNACTSEYQRSGKT